VSRTKFDAGTLRVAELRDYNLSSPRFRFIANGCNGTVCAVSPAAFHPARGVRFPTDQQVAIKAMFNYRATAAARLNTIAQQSKFDREYLVPLQHAHWSIVNVYNYFRGLCVPRLLSSDPSQYDASLFHENTTYFTMELCQASLEAWYAQRRTTRGIAPAQGVFDPTAESRVVLLLMLQVLIALEHLDRCNVRHVDLKLDNLFVAPCRGGIERADVPQVLLGDFGTALLGSTYDAITNGPFDGNQANRAPEVLRPLDERAINIARTDMWAAGCILFEMIEGRHPFWSEREPEQMVTRICDLPIPAISQAWRIAASTSTEAQAVVSLLHDHLLVHNETERSSPQQAIQAIEQALWSAPARDAPDEQQWLTARCAQLYNELSAQHTTPPMMDIEHMLRARCIVARLYPLMQH
jgi:serine/threonine protein kinase